MGCNRTHRPGVLPDMNPTGTNTNTTTIPSPVGPLTLMATSAGLTRCTFRGAAGSGAVPESGGVPGSGGGPSTGEPDPTATAWLDLARRELAAYFAGELHEFTVALDLSRVGPPHRRILEALAGVRYGTTTTYGRLADQLGLDADGAREVGGALARNPILIVVPCHRVLGAGGRLTGYAGGLHTKQRLLDLEARDSTAQLTLAW
jgi:methylated-DNA-[protein]-cysteine S-methyltransferase